MTLFEQVYYLLLSVITYFRVTLGQVWPQHRDRNRKIILCYHSVSTSHWRFAISPKLFEQHLQFLQQKYDIVPLQQLLTTTATLKSQISLTFDDGYLDNLTTAAPLLQKYSLSATLFAIGSKGKTTQDELDNHIPRLSQVQIKKLHTKYGWEIGYHSNTHADFSQLSENEMKAEITVHAGKKSRRHQAPFQYFAYPRGFFSAKIIELVKKAGFSYAFTVEGLAVKNDNVYTIPRVNIEGKLSASDLLSLISPAGLQLNYILTKALYWKEYIFKPYIINQQAHQN